VCQLLDDRGNRAVRADRLQATGLELRSGATAWRPHLVGERHERVHGRPSRLPLHIRHPVDAGRHPRQGTHAMAGAMKLLVLVNHYAPDRGGGGAAYTDMCRSLAQRGVEVTVACPYPFYPEWRDKSGRNGMRLWRYEEAGVTVVRYGLMIPRDPRALLPRLGFELSLFLSALRLLPQARHADAVMAYCP